MDNNNQNRRGAVRHIKGGKGKKSWSLKKSKKSKKNRPTQSPTTGRGSKGVLSESADDEDEEDGEDFCSLDSSCDNEEFCNYDDGDSGVCESCIGVVNCEEAGFDNEKAVKACNDCP